MHNILPTQSASGAREYSGFAIIMRIGKSQGCE